MKHAKTVDPIRKPLASNGVNEYIKNAPEGYLFEANNQFSIQGLGCFMKKL